MNIGVVTVVDTRTRNQGMQSRNNVLVRIEVREYILDPADQRGIPQAQVPCRAGGDTGNNGVDISGRLTVDLDVDSVFENLLDDSRFDPNRRTQATGRLGNGILDGLDRRLIRPGAVQLLVQQRQGQLGRRPLPERTQVLGLAALGIQLGPDRAEHLLQVRRHRRELGVVHALLLVVQLREGAVCGCSGGQVAATRTLISDLEILEVQQALGRDVHKGLDVGIGGDTELLTRH
ncbi:hypothetical protein [Nocardia transvalensis]|uniref:hypothetical protein n=1 Tax=Nocardia transvalensis TaxID=37333 RepID=UPI0012F678EC|nr:hypothetical protein [Nocardia transvalensis]